MAVYDILENAENDLDVALILKDMVERFKGQVRHVGRHLVENADEIESFCQMVDAIFHDSLESIIALASNSGALPTDIKYLSQVLKDARAATQDAATVATTASLQTMAPLMAALVDIARPVNRSAAE
jgi:hypothetical protein